jgi:signal transduction histidine kinase
MRVNQKPYLNILNEQNTSGANLIRFKHGENSLTFAFAALNYTEPENNQYKYRMIGMEEDTTLAGTNHTAEYRNMRPGKYSFWVTGSNNDGLWNRAGTSISFVIRPPWAKSFTAWLVYGFFLLLILYAYTKWRTRQLVIEKNGLEKQVGERTQQIEMQKTLLEQRNQQIVEMDKIKTRFFTNISHEFRTPLTLIQGPVEEMLEKPHRMEKDRNFLKLIYKNTRHLLNLVNQLLDIAKIDSSKMKLELTEADVIDFLRTIAASFSSMAEVKHINYSYQLPIVVRHTWFDSDKIEKIVNNLLSNAFKFTPEGGKIILRADYVPGQYGLTEMLTFSVSDNGIGIPADLTEKIFDRFYQVEENLKRDSSGTGLGLSLTRDLVHLMHGEIYVTSEPGKGSTFKVNIPLGKDHLQPEEFGILPVQADSSQKVIRRITVEEDLRSSVSDLDNSEYYTGKPVVLLVEDNRDIRQHISAHFNTDYHY